jgi:hypothetical protein
MLRRTRQYGAADKSNHVLELSFFPFLLCCCSVCRLTSLMLFSRSRESVCKARWYRGLVMVYYNVPFLVHLLLHGM